MATRQVIVYALVTVGVLGFAPLVSAQPTGDVTGTVTKGDKTGTFSGTFTLQRFGVDDGQLVAHGILTGTIDIDGRTREVRRTRIALPVDLANSGVGLGGGAASAGDDCQCAALQECDVLNLVLGPLDLNLLGLEVSLNRVLLDIVANPAGGLLGSLLAALCGLNLLDVLGNLFGSLNLLAGLLNLLLLLGNLGL
jgi:hypothetical protein